MTRLLYWDNTFQRLEEMDDTQLGTVHHDLQQAYANQLNVNGTGAFFTSAFPSNAGSATDTARTQRSHPAFFIGTGTQTVGTFYFQNNPNPNLSGLQNDHAPLFWNGAAIQRSSANTLVNEVFIPVRTAILQGNELGSYRIQSGNPGNGWINKNSVAFRDSIFSNITQTQYALWLKTGGVSAPNVALTQRPLRWTGTHIERVNINGSLITNYLLPLFSQWAVGNGLRWSVSTSPQGTNRNQFLDTRRSGTQNQQFNIDSYVSTPVGGANTFEVYYLNAT